MNKSPSPEEILNQGLIQLGIRAPTDALMQYISLLNKWNKAYNLTAVRDIDTMVTRHLLDSLAILPWVRGPRILDVGSGAGFPGIPIALAQPELCVILLDSNGKKTRFLQEVKRVLQLDNIEIQQSRVENYQPINCFDTVVSRAFSDLSQMVSLTTHLLSTHGQWLAMKGRYPEKELAAIKLPHQVKTYQVPGLEGDRCCIIIENSG